MEAELATIFTDKAALELARASLELLASDARLGLDAETLQELFVAADPAVVSWSYYLPV
jgi:hypothetical protein